MKPQFPDHQALLLLHRHDGVIHALSIDGATPVPKIVPASSYILPKTTPRQPIRQKETPRNHWRFRGVLWANLVYKTAALPIELRQPAQISLNTY